MSLYAKKCVLLVSIALLMILANTLAIADWLDGTGVAALARHIRSEYLTGTAVTVILALLFLLGGPGLAIAGAGMMRRCSVCDRAMFRKAKYCGACGSRL
ncbi:MAG TPA: hypothetical protein PK093_05600 [Phycisphaerae bacterium]|nr:hypothetical protein [Phycisphaerae bacterium]